METNPSRARRRAQSAYDAELAQRREVRSSGWFTTVRLGIEARVQGRK